MIGRRRFLLGAGAAGVLVSAEAARRVWRELARAPATAADLAPGHLALITTLADAILPATDTPGAVALRVPEWIAVLVASGFTEPARARFLGGLDAMDQAAAAAFGRPVPGLAPAELAELIDGWDQPGSALRFALRVQGALARRLPAGSLRTAAERFGQARRAFTELKGLIVHGYFTSEAVQRDVMHVHWA
jgi:hypothetical protein